MTKTKLQVIRNKLRTQIWWFSICFNTPKFYQFAARMLGPAK